MSLIFCVFYSMQCPQMKRQYILLYFALVLNFALGYVLYIVELCHSDYTHTKKDLAWLGYS
jgi:hypothetical protein